jgi:hypothetical protein
VPEGLTVARYIIHFANGEIRELPISWTHNIHSAWWAPWRPRKMGENCHVAWQGHSLATRARDGALWLYRTAWENPFPEVEITHIDLITNPPNTILLLFGITGEP